MQNNGFPIGNYTPSGYNDNNQNRQRVPSNIFPANGGMSGNPFGRFNPMTYNQQQQMKYNPNMSNFNQAFEKRNQIIEPIDYRNTGNLLHNNVGPVVLNEQITEYRINIDSLDRDIRVYPNPFDFKVKFNPSSNGIVRTEVKKRGKLKTINDFFDGQPGPHIVRNFRNVKYIKLDNIVLPQHTEFCEIINDENEKELIFDKNSNLLDDRFVSLSIKELECNRIYDTFDDGIRFDSKTGELFTPSKIFGIIFPDKRLGRNFYTGTPFYSTKVYDNSQLGNLDNLTIKFYDSCGVPLKINNLYTYNELCQAEENGNPIPIYDLKHPLNKKHQLHLSFVVGVIEAQINNNIKFEIS